MYGYLSALELMCFYRYKPLFDFHIANIKLIFQTKFSTQAVVRINFYAIQHIYFLY